MRLIATRVERTGEVVRLVGIVETAQGATVEPYFEFAREFDSYVSATADPFVIALLVPAMAAGETLESVPPVSEALLFNLPSVRDIFHAWYPRLAHIRIEAQPRVDANPQRAQHAATFFSGGIDSFYSLLKRRTYDPLPAPLTHMIYMHGIERSLEDTRDSVATEAQSRAIASATDVQCVVGRTNLRTLFPLHWEHYYFGSALAATAVSLSRGLGYVCIPSAFSYLYQPPHGSSALVDSRFSTETIRIVHDGCEANRAEKTAKILEWEPQLVLPHLRVCIENRGAAFNCGKCYKCVRTALTLRALGMWDKAVTFPEKSSSHWRKVARKDHPIMVRDTLGLARARNADRKLIELLEGIVREHERYEGLATLAKSSPLEHLLPAFRAMRRLVGGKPRMH